MDIHEKDRSEMKAIQAVFEQAVENNTIDDLRPYVDPEFSFVSFTDTEFNHFDEFREQWSLTRKKMIGSGKFLTWLNPEPTLFFDQIAVCRGNSQNEMINDEGVVYNFTSHWSVIFRRNNGEWKIVRAHNSLNPFSNPMLVHGIKKRIIKYSLLSFFSGLLLCFILTFIFLI